MLVAYDVDPRLVVAALLLFAFMDEDEVMPVKVLLLLLPLMIPVGYVRRLISTNDGDTEDDELPPPAEEVEDAVTTRA